MSFEDSSVSEEQKDGEERGRHFFGISAIMSLERATLSAGNKTKTKIWREEWGLSLCEGNDMNSQVFDPNVKGRKQVQHQGRKFALWQRNHPFVLMVTMSRIVRCN